MTKRFLKGLGRWPLGVTAGPFNFYSGQMGLAKGEPIRDYAQVPGVAPASEFAWINRMEAPVGAQGEAIYARYRRLLEAEGGYGQLLRYHIYQRDKRFFSVFDRVRRQYETAPPASTAVGVGRFEPTDEVRLCIDSIVLRAESTLGPRSVHGGSGKHAAAAHFSHVISADPFLFLAGQIPVDTSLPGSPLIRNYEDIPAEGHFLRVGRSHEDARNGPIAAQTWFTYDLIRKHLEGAGSSMDHILNLIVYLQDMRDFPTFHRVHERFFGASPPALTVIDVGEVGHKGTLLEIEPTAIVANARLKRNAYADERSPKPAHMSAAVEAGGLAFVSGIPGAMPDGTVPQAISELPAAWRRHSLVAGKRRPDALAVQTAAVIGQLTQRMAAMGRDLSRVVHLTVYVDEIEAFARVAPLLERAFGRRRPALMVLEVPHPAPIEGVHISVTAIAWTGAGAPSVITG